ncbi:branched chain amino acid--2-keto-4-methylthiobutyrate aminotransferase [soil metagenome]
MLLGEGVFETCKVMAGTQFALTRHLARLRRSASQVGVAVPWSDDRLRAAVAEALAGPGEAGGSGEGEAGGGDASGVGGGPRRLRITITGGASGPAPVRPLRASEPAVTELGGRSGFADQSGREGSRLMVTVGPGRVWSPTIDVVVSPWRVNEHSPLTGAKTTSHLEYVLALAEARRRGAEEAVLTNTAGALCEASSSNLFVVVNGALCTPSVATGCLGGVTRELVAEVVEVVARDDLTVDALRGASEAFLTSSTRDVHPIAAVDGRPLCAAPGPLTTLAQDAFASLQRRTLDP